MPDVTPVAIVFTEIPVADAQRACNFYQTLFGAPLIHDDQGPNPVWMFPHGAEGHPIGHLYPGTPAQHGAGMTAHFAVTDDLGDAMDRVRRGGGEVVSEVIDIPSGAFFYAIDSEGNSLGLFRYKR
ncbi:MULTISPECIES: VOC family protein [unclassified Sphingomonas]|uniref:VOC family protein n=1 Tax=unclassified Sphingomonas TaxID=196159 RepID=UPI0008333D4D|nr:MULTISPECIES: VOC family protein [unclassified Sphingomonas]